MSNSRSWVTVLLIGFAAVFSLGVQAQVAPTDSVGAEFDFDANQQPGVVPIGTAGLELVGGVDHVDVEFTGKPGTFGVEGTLTSDSELGFLPDLDFFLYEVADNGELNELDNSGNFGCLLHLWCQSWDYRARSNVSIANPRVGRARIAQGATQTVAQELLLPRPDQALAD